MATTAIAPGTMKVAQVYKPGAGIQIVKREIPEHGPGQVRLSLVTKKEESLLARARAGDTAGFANLVMPHRDGILRRIQRILHNREDAEDAVQTAILDALRHLDTFQGRSRFSSWLTRIALNAAFMRLRTGRRKNEASLDEMVERETAARFEVVEGRPNPEQECSLKEARVVVAKAIDRLGASLRRGSPYVSCAGVAREGGCKNPGRASGNSQGEIASRSKLSRHLQSMLVQRKRLGSARNGCTAFKSRSAFDL